MEAAQAATQFAPASRHDGPPLAEGQAPGLEGTDYYSPPHATCGSTASTAPWSRSTPDLCTVKIQIRQAIDDGNMINPMIVEGQVHGGIAQGLGARRPARTLEPSGNLANANFVDFLVPYATEIPNIEVLHLETPSPLMNPLGVKGVGEAGCIAVGAVGGVAVGRSAQAARRRQIPSCAPTPSMI